MKDRDFEHYYDKYTRIYYEKETKELVLLGLKTVNIKFIRYYNRHNKHVETFWVVKDDFKKKFVYVGDI